MCHVCGSKCKLSLSLSFILLAAYAYFLSLSFSHPQNRRTKNYIEQIINFFQNFSLSEMASTAGGSATVTGCPSSYFRRKASTLSFTTMTIGKVVTVHKSISCSAVQESSTPAVAIETKDKEPSVAKTAAADPAKPKPKPKAPVKPLAELIEEEVIPSLKSTLESQNDIFDLELSFADNKLEGSFVKKGNPYTFWAFFPDGVLTGPKGFSLSSYGMEASTVEPFLVDEKKITAKLVVFWVEKRLAAQGIIPVWRNE